MNKREYLALHETKKETSVNLYGNGEPCPFPYQIKIEYTQKTVNPTISVYGGSLDQMMETIERAHNKIVNLFENKLGRKVAPLMVPEK